MRLPVIIIPALGGGLLGHTQELPRSCPVGNNQDSCTASQMTPYWCQDEWYSGPCTRHHMLSVRHLVAAVPTVLQRRRCVRGMVSEDLGGNDTSHSVKQSLTHKPSRTFVVIGR